ncbi:MAG: DNA replication protein DnaC, partial [Intestinibacter sp.]
MKDSAVREILLSYQKKRDKAEYEFEERKKRIYNKFPEIEKIDDEITNIGLKMMRLVLSSSPDKEDLLKKCR